MNTNTTAEAHKPLRVRDVMRLTGRGENTVYDALNSGALAGSQAKPGSCWFITPTAVDAWVADGCPRYAVAS